MRQASKLKEITTKLILEEHNISAQGFTWFIIVSDFYSSVSFPIMTINLKGERCNLDIYVLNNLSVMDLSNLFVFSVCDTALKTSIRFINYHRK